MVRGDDPARARAGHDAAGRGDRDRGGARVPPRGRMPPGPGLPLRPTRARPRRSPAPGRRNRFPHRLAGLTRCNGARVHAPLRMPDHAIRYDAVRDRAEVAAGLGGRGAVPRLRRPRRPAAPFLRARHVPVPLGRPAHGPRRGLQRRRRDRAVPLDAGLQRAASDRLGLVRTACGERGDQARDPPEGVDVREHRAAGGVVQADGDVVRLDASAAQQRSRVLPVDAVAVPEAVRAWAWPTGRTRRRTGAPRTRRCSPTSR